MQSQLLLCTLLSAITFSVGQMFYQESQPSNKPQSGESCITPKNDPGVCVKMRHCPVLLHILQIQQSKPGAKEFLLNSRCSKYRPYDVCCPNTQSRSTQAPPARQEDFNLMSPPQCGKSYVKSQTKIVGGQPAKLGMWPWIALLGYITNQKPGPFWKCGGSLISKNHVLTAAHCINIKNMKLYVVRLGESEINNDNDGAKPVNVMVDSAIAHPDYSRVKRTDDIGLIKLQQPVAFTRQIQPICLPIAAEMRFQSFANYNPFVVGWGSTVHDGPYSTKLLQTQIPVVDNKSCNNSYAPLRSPIIEEQLCAGYLRGGKDACQGDSGGPLMLPWGTAYYLIGIVSFGYKCAESGYPGIYTRVTSYLAWISNSISRCSESRSSDVYCQKTQTRATQLTPIKQEEFSTPLIEATTLSEFPRDSTLGGESCTTPKNDQGVCVNIRQCPVLLDLLQNEHGKPGVVEFLRKCRCSEYRSSDVCCPSTQSRSTQPPAKGQEEFMNFTSPPQCGKSRVNLQTRIIGGEPTKLGAWPWIALIGATASILPQPSWHCAGSLISEQHILAAAHCLMPPNWPPIFKYIVRLGESELDNDKDGAKPVDVKVDSAIAHSSYVRKTKSNDIALFKLQHPVQFTQLIQPICLPISVEMRSQSFAKYSPFVAGWGALREGGPMSNKLMQVQVPVVENESCKKSYAQRIPITEKQICAGFLEGGKDACQGDSGGPLMLPHGTSYYLIGVVSYGYKCAEPGYPGIYTRVTSYLDWISNTM